MKNANINVTANVNMNKGENTMKKINITLPTMNNGDQLILTFVDGVPCFKNMSGEIVNVNIFNTVEVNIGEEVKKQGFVRDRKDNKRWIMAQMFKAMDYRKDKPSGIIKGFDAYYKTEKPYMYQWKVICDILDDMAKMEKEKRFKELEIEQMFFNRDVVNRLLIEFYETVMQKEKKRILDGYSFYKMKLGVRYDGTDFERKCWAYNREDRELSLKAIDALPIVIASIINEKNAEKYAKKVRELFEVRIPRIVIIDNKTEKAKLWLDTFKGRGAYYTLKNMITGGHNCCLKSPSGKVLDADDSMAYLNAYAKTCKTGEGYKIMGMLKQCIKYNDFDFYTRMKEIN